MSRHGVLRFLVLLAGVGVLAAPQSSFAAPIFRKTDCGFQPSASAGRIDCGVVSVPADRTQDTGPRIDLGVVVLHSRNPDKRPEPVVFLHGGPGSSALRGVARFYEHPLRQERDLILFDQRGSWKSGEFCGDVDQGILEAFAADLSLEAQAQAIADLMRKCRREAEGAGIRFEHYKTSTIAADLEDIRLALGVPRWNLWGVSYGTAVAQAAAHRFPEGLRSVVLDSVSLNAPGWRSETGKNYEFALTRVFQLCAADPACAERYGDLRAKYDQTLAMLEVSPISVTIEIDPPVPEDRFVMNRQDFILILHQLLYSPKLIPYVPLVIERLHAGDRQVVANLGETLQGRALGKSFGAHYAIDCQGRGMSKEGSDAARRQAAFPLTAQYAAVCEALGLENSDSLSQPRGKSAIPALILTGALDPITPPTTAARAAADFEHVQVVEFAGQGHTVTSSSSCARSIMQAFIEHPRETPDTRCTGSMAPPRFVAELVVAPTVFPFATGVFVKRRLAVLVPLALAVVLLVVGAWRGISALLRSKRSRVRSAVRAGASLAALVALVGLVGLIALTGSGGDDALLLFGLPSQARLIFALAWMTVGLASVEVVLWIREVR